MPKNGFLLRFLHENGAFHIDAVKLSHEKRIEFETKRGFVMKIKIFKRVVAMVLALVMTCGVLPLGVFADEPVVKVESDVQTTPDGSTTDAKLVIKVNADRLVEILKTNGISSSIVSDIKSGVSVDVASLLEVISIDEILEIISADKIVNAIKLENMLDELGDKVNVIFDFDTLIKGLTDEQLEAVVKDEAAFSIVLDYYENSEDGLAGLLETLLHAGTPDDPADPDYDGIPDDCPIDIEALINASFWHTENNKKFFDSENIYKIEVEKYIKDSHGNGYIYLSDFLNYWPKDEHGQYKIDFLNFATDVQVDNFLSKAEVAGHGIEEYVNIKGMIDMLFVEAPGILDEIRTNPEGFFPGQGADTIEGWITAKDDWDEDDFNVTALKEGLGEPSMSDEDLALIISNEPERIESLIVGEPSKYILPATLDELITTDRLSALSQYADLLAFRKAALAYNFDETLAYDYVDLSEYLADPDHRDYLVYNMEEFLTATGMDKMHHAIDVFHLATESIGVNNIIKEEGLETVLSCLNLNEIMNAIGKDNLSDYVDLMGVVEVIGVGELLNIIKESGASLTDVIDLDAFIEAVGAETLLGQLSNSEIVEIVKLDAFKEAIPNLITVVLSEILYDINEVKINDTVVAAEDRSTLAGRLVIDLEALMGVMIEMLPELEQIAELKDDKLFTFDFGFTYKNDERQNITKNFGVEVVIDGGADKVREAATKLNDLVTRYVRYEIEPDLSVTLDLSIPSPFTTLYAKVLMSADIDDAARQKLLNLSSAEKDAVGFVDSLTYDEIITILKTVDTEALYDKAMQISFVEKLMEKLAERSGKDLSSITINEAVAILDDAVDKAGSKSAVEKVYALIESKLGIDVTTLLDDADLTDIAGFAEDKRAEFEDVFTKVKNYLLAALDRVATYAPDMLKTPLGDLYTNKGTFHSFESMSHTFKSREMVEKLLTKALEGRVELSEDIVEYASLFFPEEFTVNPSLDLTVRFAKIYRVTYHDVDNHVIREVFMPIGTDPSIYEGYAPDEMIFLGWSTEPNGEIATEVTGDMDLYPVIEDPEDRYTIVEFKDGYGNVVKSIRKLKGSYFTAAEIAELPTDLERAPEDPNYQYIWRWVQDGWSLSAHPNNQKVDLTTVEITDGIVFYSTFVQKYYDEDYGPITTPSEDGDEYTIETDGIFDAADPEEGVTIVLPEELVDHAVNEDEDVSITVKDSASGASVTVDDATLTQLDELAQGEQIAILYKQNLEFEFNYYNETNAVQYTFDFLIGEELKSYSDLVEEGGSNLFDGAVTFHVPFDAIEQTATQKTHVYYADEETGERVLIEAQIVNGIVIFDAPHFSEFIIVNEYKVTYDFESINKPEDTLEGTLGGIFDGVHPADEFGNTNYTFVPGVEITLTPAVTSHQNYDVMEVYLSDSDSTLGTAIGAPYTFTLPEQASYLTVQAEYNVKHTVTFVFNGVTYTTRDVIYGYSLQDMIDRLLADAVTDPTQTYVDDSTENLGYQIEYMFDYWYLNNPAVSVDINNLIVTEDITIVAQVKEYTRYYEVSFEDYNGTPMGSIWVENGETVALDPDFSFVTEPTRPSETDNTTYRIDYAFDAWIGALNEDINTPITAPLTLTATYEDTYFFCVTFKDANGGEYAKIWVEEGTVISADDEYAAVGEPEKDPVGTATERTEYTFSGWSVDVDVTTVSGAMSIDPTYTASSAYLITFNNNGSEFTTIWATEGIALQDDPDFAGVAVPTKDDYQDTDTHKFVYEFYRWYNATTGDTVETVVSGPMTLDAEYTPIDYYLVIFKNNDLDATEIGRIWVEKGTKIEDAVDFDSLPTPTTPDTGDNDNHKYVWTFDEWVCETGETVSSLITGPLVLTATYTYTEYFRVVFKNYDNTVITKIWVEKGEKVTDTAEYQNLMLTDPIKPTEISGGHKTVYSFREWLGDNGEAVDIAITEPTPMTAQYDSTEYYEVTFTDYLGNTIGSPIWVLDGSKITNAPTAPNRDDLTEGDKKTAYTFVGWKLGDNLVNLNTFTVNGSPVVLQATYSETYYYRVIFTDHLGNTIGSPIWVLDGSKITNAPTAPNRDDLTEGTKKTIYSFAGWKLGDNLVNLDTFTVNGATTLKASYSERYQYLVTFKNPDGSIVKSIWVDEGGVISADDDYNSVGTPTTPDREDVIDVHKFVYVFKGWKNADGETVDSVVNSAMEFVAEYDTFDYYRVIFVDHDGSEQKFWVKKGDVIKDAVTIADPTRAIYEQDGHKIVYTFTGWLGANGETKDSVVNEAITLTAQYDETHSYLVTFRDYDGAELGSFWVEVGQKIEDVVNITDPTRTTYNDESHMIVYTFDGWKNAADETVETVISDHAITLQAQYAETHSYRVIFRDYNGTELGKFWVEVGQKIADVVTIADPTRATYDDDMHKIVYAFSGWLGANNETMETIVSDGVVTLTAQYDDTHSYRVIFKDHDGTELGKFWVEVGDKIEDVANIADPTRTTYNDESHMIVYTFDGWKNAADETVETVISDHAITLQAQYAETHSYRVTFQDYNGTELGKFWVEKGQKISDVCNVADPSRTTELNGGHKVEYEFISWKSAQNDTVDTVITDRAITLTAQYEDTHFYLVTFRDYDLSLIQNFWVEVGDKISESVTIADPTRANGGNGTDYKIEYAFSDWNGANGETVDDVIVDHAITFTAQYDDTHFYLVSFKDYNQSLIKSFWVEVGDKISESVTVADPTRANGGNGTDYKIEYTFTGWLGANNETVNDVIADHAVTFTAQYDAAHFYLITFRDYDEAEIAAFWVEAGDKISESVTIEDPTRSNGGNGTDYKIEYIFTQWLGVNNETVDLTVDRAITLYAQYSEIHSYLVTLVDYDGSIYDRFWVKKGDSITDDRDYTPYNADLTVPVGTDKYLYKFEFVSWQKGDAVYDMETPINGAVTLHVSLKKIYYMDGVDQDADVTAEFVGDSYVVKVEEGFDSVTLPAIIGQYTADYVADDEKDAKWILTVVDEDGNKLYDLLVVEESMLEKLYAEGGMISFAYGKMTDFEYGVYNETNAEGFVFQFLCDGNAYTPEDGETFDGGVTVRVPFEWASKNDNAQTVLYHVVGNDGTLVTDGRKVKQENGIKVIEFVPEHFSYYLVANEFLVVNGGAVHGDKKLPTPAPTISVNLTGYGINTYYAAGEKVVVTPTDVTEGYSISNVYYLDAQGKKVNLNRISDTKWELTVPAYSVDVLVELMPVEYVLNYYVKVENNGTVAYELAKTDSYTAHELAIKKSDVIDQHLANTEEILKRDDLYLPGDAYTFGGWIGYSEEKLGTSDMNLYLEVKPIDFTLNFVDTMGEEPLVVGSILFNVEDTELAAFAIPHKEGYNGSCPALATFDIQAVIADLIAEGADSVDVELVYTPCTYEIFYDDEVITVTGDPYFGNTITLEVVEKEAHEVAITVVTLGGETVTVTDGAFTMPADSVQITVTYTPVGNAVYYINDRPYYGSMIGDVATFEIRYTKGYRVASVSADCTLISSSVEGDVCVMVYTFTVEDGKRIEYVIEEVKYDGLHIFNGTDYDGTEPPVTTEDDVTFEGWSASILGAFAFATFGLENTVSVVCVWIAILLALLIIAVVVLYQLSIHGKLKNNFLSRFAVWTVNLFFAICLWIAKIGTALRRKNKAEDDEDDEPKNNA